MRYPLAALGILFLLPCGPAHGQTDSLLQDGTEVQEQLIEDVIAASEDDSDEFSFNAAFSLLEAYRRRPLDLNRATYDELTETLLLSSLQVDQLLDYRDRMGRLISIYELQAVPGMDLETISRLRPFVTVAGGLDDTQIGLGRMFREGNGELFLRAQRRLERARGYRLDPDEATNFYTGNPWRYYAKYRHRYGNRLSAGVVMEKDPGEPFFSGTNRRRGFDYYSAHFFLRNVNRRIKALALGDFTVSFGQGLILYTGFGFGKSSRTITIARGGEALRPYASVNEFSFMRGAGVTLNITPTVEATVFGSRRGRNANLIEASLDSLDGEFFAVSSLNLSGFNRTPNEIADRNAITQVSTGGSVRFQPNRNLRLAANLLYENLSRPLDLSDQPYNRFFFQGRDLTNASLDYRYRLRNVTLFGEVAVSDNGGTSQLHGLLTSLDRRLDLALAYRNYDRDYQTLNARPFGETNGGRNETGLYLGLELRPATRWQLNAFYDIWRHPWLRFNTDAPSSGREYRLRLTYTERRRMTVYGEVRSETKGFGTDGDEREFTNLDPVVERTRFQGRFHFAFTASPALELRSRLDAGFTEDPLNGRQNGMMIYQDVIATPLPNLRLTARFAVFNTDGFDVRFYEYENALTYNARVLPYYDRGTRSYLVLRYKGIRRLTLEARLAQTYFRDGDGSIGSGLEEIEGNRRTEIGTQAIYRF